MENIKSLVFVDLSPKPLSTNHAEDWVEGQLDDIAAAYTTFLQNPEGNVNLSRDMQRMLSLA